MILHWDALEPRERRLEVRELESLRPVVLVRGAEHLEDFEDLINLTVAGEQRSFLGHLCEDATSGPQIHPE